MIIRANWVRLIGYCAFAMACLPVFYYLSFPSERAAKRIEDVIGATGVARARVGSASPAFGVGLTLRDVTLDFSGGPETQPATLAGTVSAVQRRRAAADKSIELDRVTVKPVLWRLLFGKKALAFDIVGMGGELEGQYRMDADKTLALELELEQLEMAKVPQLQELGIPLRGVLSLKLDVELPGGRVGAADGHIAIDCAECSIGNNKAKLKIPGNPMLAMGITLPRLNLGHLDAKIELKQGQATVERFSAQSKDIEAHLEGSVQLREPFIFSMADLYFRFELSPELIKREPKFEVVTGALAEGKRPDGSFGIHIGGSLRLPRAVPSKTGPTRSLSHG